MHQRTTPEPQAAPRAATGGTSPFARRPLSTLGRIAFWAYLVELLGGIGGAIAIAAGTGAPSRDIVTLAVLALAGTVLVASGVLLAQAIGALVGAAILYLALTEPFVVQSLANPKGPNGGLGHFVGDVLVLAVAILGLVANVGAVAQDYRQGDHPGGRGAPRWLRPAVSAIAGAAVGAVFIGALAQPAAPTGTTYTNGVPTVHMDAGSFIEPSVTIPRGSKLLLVDDSSSVHILANGSWQNRLARPGREPGAPLVANVRLSADSATIGPFAAAGTYHIYCEVHPGMNLTIIVQ
jgi:plastocyanin